MKSNSNAAPGDDDEPPLWQFVRLDAYQPPSASARSAVAGMWASARRLLSRKDEVETPLKAEADLRALPEVRLAHVVQPIDWGDAVDALDACLVEWTADPAARPAVQVVVGPPHGGHAEIVAQWGQRHGARQIHAPTAAQIMAAPHGHAIETLSEPTWVLPRLEHFFLRRTGGLALVRAVLEQIGSDTTGHGLVGCDSWAWAYLQHAWSGPMPNALTLAAFDGARLARLFAHLAAPRAPTALLFRNAKTGSDVLTVPRPAPQDAASEDIQRIAVHCRGNPGTARGYWRERLRDTPDLNTDAAAARAVADTAQPTTSAASSPTRAPPHDVVWVSADDGVPAAPFEATEDAALLLHTLLLHGGLQPDVLPALLNAAPHQTRALLLRLAALGLVAQGPDARWCVAPLAYATVRELLRAGGYLTDSL